MSIKTVIEYKGQEHPVYSLDFKENTLLEAINAVREAKLKSEEFLTKMLSEELKEEPTKKVKKAQENGDAVSGGSDIEEEEPPRDDRDDAELVAANMDLDGDNA
mmetsp:Transcript_1644/g.1752  ORF Transcript_1644/g.1752 Transcript_1644/m.1752 type:complete len:104 (-) Transcript_1644:73-384(-)